MADLTRMHWTQMLSPHREPCLLATTGDVNLPFFCPDAIDGVGLTVGDRILVWKQTIGNQNGTYRVDVVGGGANGEWSRTDDFDDEDKFETGISWRIQRGDTYAGRNFYLATQGVIILDNTALEILEGGSFLAEDFVDERIFDDFNGADDDPLSDLWIISNEGGNSVVQSGDKAKWNVAAVDQTASATAIARPKIVGRDINIEWKAKRLITAEATLLIIARAQGQDDASLGERYILEWEDGEANPKLKHIASDDTETLLATIAGMTLDNSERVYRWTIEDEQNGDVEHTFYLAGASVGSHTDSVYLHRDEGFVGMRVEVTSALTSDGLNYVEVDDFEAENFDAIAAAGGDVVGPGAAVDNAVARYDGVTGKLIQSSNVTIDDAGSVNIPAGETYDINGTPLAATDVGADPAGSAAAAQAAAEATAAGDATAKANAAEAAAILASLQNVVEDLTPQAGGVFSMNAHQMRWSKGGDLASPGGGALTLGTDGNEFDITGVNAITSIVTVAVGTLAILHFDGILVFTHHATDLILPGGANITTAAGDMAIVYEYATGDWRCLVYTKADGTAVVGGGGGSILPEVLRFKTGSFDLVETSFAPIEKLTDGAIIHMMHSFDYAAIEYVNSKFMVPGDIDPAGTVTFRAFVKPRAAPVAPEDVVVQIEHAAVDSTELLGAAAYTAEVAAAATITTAALIEIIWTETVANLGWVGYDENFLRYSRKSTDALDTLDTRADTDDDLLLDELVIEIPLA